MRRNVSFGDVRVRFHERTISDNPAVRSSEPFATSKARLIAGSKLSTVSLPDPLRSE